MYLVFTRMPVTVGDSGLCCRTCVTYFERQLTPLCVDSARCSGLRSVSDSSTNRLLTLYRLARLAYLFIFTEMSILYCRSRQWNKTEGLSGGWDKKQHRKDIELITGSRFRADLVLCEWKEQRHTIFNLSAVFTLFYLICHFFSFFFLFSFLTMR